MNVVTYLQEGGRVSTSQQICEQTSQAAPVAKAIHDYGVATWTTVLGGAGVAGWWILRFVGGKAVDYMHRVQTVEQTKIGIEEYQRGQAQVLNAIDKMRAEYAKSNERLESKVDSMHGLFDQHLRDHANADK